MFMIGIDPHKGSHTAAAVDHSETVLDDLWLHSLDAVVVFVRCAAEHRQLTIAEVTALLRGT